jgi:orotidine-5'-phosphate decarboxylase
MAPLLASTYLERAANYTNPAAVNLLQTIDRKRSNLCVSVDVTRKAEFLRIVDAVGPYVCLIKAR